MAYSVNLFAGWAGFLAGVLTGAGIGLRFHRADWLGGYSSFRRRMVRLGHIACFGIGLIDILFALSTAHLAPSPTLAAGSSLLVVALVAMPLTCFLTAWKEGFRHLFFIPVVSTAAGIAALLLALR